MKKKANSKQAPGSPRRAAPPNPEALKRAKHIVDSLVATSDLAALQTFVSVRDQELDAELERLTKTLATLRPPLPPQSSALDAIPTPSRSRSRTSPLRSRSTLQVDYGDAWPGHRPSSSGATHGERSLGATVEQPSFVDPATGHLPTPLAHIMTSEDRLRASVAEHGIGLVSQSVPDESSAFAQLLRLQAENSALRRELDSLDPSFFDELEDMKYK
jgi:hypothetical protein